MYVVHEDRGREAKSRPGKTIAYCCVTRAHWKKPAAPNATNTVTIVRGEWAFCPHDALGDGHEWHPTGGVDAEDVRRMVRRGKPDEFIRRSDAKSA